MLLVLNIESNMYITLKIVSCAIFGVYPSNTWNGIKLIEKASSYTLCFAIDFSRANWFWYEYENMNYRKIIACLQYTEISKWIKLNIHWPSQRLTNLAFFQRPKDRKHSLQRTKILQSFFFQELAWFKVTSI